MSFLQQIAYIPVAGFPLIAILGIVTYLLLAATSAVMILNRKRITRFPLKYHSRLAYATILVGTAHGLLAISVYL